VTKITDYGKLTDEQMKALIKGLYDPISIDFYQKLSVFIKRKQKVRIWYLNEKGLKQKSDTVITDILNEENAEWIKTENGLRIRADKILEAGGVIVRIPIFGFQIE
jgi:beta-glucosidase/6-phospho-beta-glucosidase/beta-galactosidase